MTFEEILDQAMAMLQRRGRLTYGTLKRQFQLDDAALDDLKNELIAGQRVAVDEQGTVLVWTGAEVSIPPPTASSARSQDRPPLSYTPKHLAEKILTTRSTLEGERKPVTVLFCDIAHSTSLAQRLGPEAMHTLLQRFFERGLDAVHRYEGTINQFLGDGFMALFGAPIAYEDHARRAVLAALEIQHRLGERRADFGLPPGEDLAIRIGLHTGLVVVGSIGDNLRMDYTAVGDTTHLAARLQQSALPGVILLSQTTSRLVQDQVYVEAIAPFQVKGIAAPVVACKLLGTRPRRSPGARLGERTLSRFVGRERDLAVLHEVLARVEAGQGQVVGIVGEAGVGKSRFLHELRQRLTGQRLTYLAGSCLSYGQAIPYLPLLDLLRHNCGITEADSPETITARVHLGLQEVGLDPAAGTPYLLHLLGVHAGTESLAVLSPEAIKTRTFDTLRQMSLRGSRQRPLLLEVEDLHWIDQTSEAYLLSLVERLVGAPILLLGTYRPGYRPPWGEKSYAMQVALRPLGPRDGLVVVRSIAPREGLSDQLAQVIVAKAEGNPLFLEELTRAVVEQGALHADAAVPDTIQGVLMARIDRLPDAAKRLLQTASVLGRAFSLRLLGTTWEGPGAVEALLGELRRLEFVYEDTGAEEPVYVFKHVLTQEVAYGSLLHARRRGLHARIVEAIETLYADRLAEQVDRLARHAFWGERWAKAVTYCQQAGARARDRAAFREAVTAFEQALEALAHLPEDGDTRVLAIDIRLALGGTLTLLGEHARHHALLGEAETLARALDDRARLGSVLSWMAQVHRLMGDYDGAIAAGQQALVLAAALGDSVLQAHATFYLGVVYHLIGDFGQAAALLRRNVEAADRESGTPGTDWLIRSTDRRLRSLACLARTLSALGAFAEGRRHGEEALRLATRDGRGIIPIVVHGCLGLLYLAQGDLEHAIRVLEQGLALCRASGGRGFWSPAIMADLGYAAALQGRLADGRPLLEEAISESLHMGAPLVSAYARLSEVCRLAGRGEEAWQHAHQALDLARQQKERGNEALALHQLGVVQAHAGPPDAAQAGTHYQQALALAEELGMRPLVAHCHRGLGTLYAMTGQREQARAELATAMEMYRAMDMAFWLPETEAALAQVEGR
jgi:class 3 adenylate cyclase/tetratricopeptide (TPR) repeat protein